MKNLSLYLALLLVSLYSCQQEDSDLSELQGIVRFGSISLEFEPMGSPGSRISGFSPWVNVFPNSADIVFTNKVTNEEYKLEYYPNDFTTPFSISLPFGSYSFYSKIEAEVFSDFLPFEASGEFILNSQSLELSLQAKTDYGLISVKDKYVEKVFVTNGTTESLLNLPDGFTYWYKYVKGGSNVTLKIEESFSGSTVKRDLIILANRHYNFVLKLGEGSAVITNLILDPFELEEEEITIGSKSVFFEENGTIKCPKASPGDKGEVNGKTYEAVDRALLIQRRDEGADLTCVCTSLVTDMTQIILESFEGNITNWDVSNVTSMRLMFFNTSVNQPIGKWDVSNVKDMSWMFSESYFNQPIGDWNVTNVTNMFGMFERAWGFNQPIGDWDVSNVTNMRKMFDEAENFNQPIGNWDVSSVTNMDFMFLNSPFNQPIENWNVSNVTSMEGLFTTSSFNQPIGNWNVSNVTNMSKMFEGATHFNQSIGNWDDSKVTNMSSMFTNAWKFNQPIGNWNVSNVTDLRFMFEEAFLFNQDLSSWCVENITGEPTNFSRESPLISSFKPNWGTCPD